MKTYDLIILGAGTSGIYCASYGAMKGLKSLVIEMTDRIGGQPTHLYPFKKIYDFPTANGILAKDFINLLSNQQDSYIKQGLITYSLNTLISFQKYLTSENLFELTLSNNSIVRSKKIIIATGNGGFEPIRLNEDLIRNQDISNIHYQINDLLIYKNKDVCFLGGGDSAVELINQLADLKIANSLSIVHRNNKYRASQNLVDQINQKDINQYLDQTIESINNNTINLINNQNNQKTTINFDYLIVQYGLKPIKSLDCFDHLEQDLNNNLIVNDFQQTSDDNIYAIGLASNYKKRPNLIICGMNEAVVAIKHINDLINPYTRSVDYLIK
ncbi:NAD(P)/FAD-dependent oxidoreductase [Mycoplasma bradburyae]|uniref:Ferredoxin--NADP reductase n=1 Tax=Mycoplasma bradburyae TaxID=2963128 RepID=A0AAW6HPM8_9MOLU|nr:NAD(P)/FAD-dependent oxidoreductase [Mycoplasma bradburyae]MDC4163368.1 NAD(P)/FAD-dependent oxidoreductase [Mycoplasma bradburyae]MDC4181982.1 NAD(P)/FAD-dependent oxidoreductase [Mycoplasma bradburyae]MDC4182685.1 NAD(P)/FAD-dependent oxidoreductase [Mycoplasma bradburyae]MDC4183357.1 NAD(P)/FAD-dependent oxidoreductase [Mycoplasma bradburyae]MDC4184165.1 NAD(P)/FAD-dependent oxidoreductase [Mycoplasma bradburyae]